MVIEHQPKKKLLLLLNFEIQTLYLFQKKTNGKWIKSIQKNSKISSAMPPYRNNAHAKVDPGG
jgi:hypothetical protein